MKYHCYGFCDSLRYLVCFPSSIYRTAIKQQGNFSSTSVQVTTHVPSATVSLLPMLV